jgi:uncharacterized protein YeaO (DUF488 family)
MVRLRRVYEPAAKDDGYRVLVDRLWPRGMKKEAAKIDLWMKDIAPSDALRKAFHHDAMNWPDFQKKYQVELKSKKEWLAQLKKLEEEHGTLTLLFGTRDSEHNHAAIIAEALKKN